MKKPVLLYATATACLYGQGQSGPMWFYAPDQAMILRLDGFMEYYYRDRDTRDNVTDFLLEANL